VRNAGEGAQCALHEAAVRNVIMCVERYPARKTARRLQGSLTGISMSVVAYETHTFRDEILLRTQNYKCVMQK
jgi:hypothetical protein